MRSNWPAACRPRPSPASVITVKCGLRTSIQPDPFSRAQPLSDTSKTSRETRLSMMCLGILTLFTHAQQSTFHRSRGSLRTAGGSGAMAAQEAPPHSARGQSHPCLGLSLAALSPWSAASPRPSSRIALDQRLRPVRHCPLHDRRRYPARRVDHRRLGTPAAPAPRVIGWSRWSRSIN